MTHYRWIVLLAAGATLLGCSTTQTGTASPETTTPPPPTPTSFVLSPLVTLSTTAPTTALEPAPSPSRTPKPPAPPVAPKPPGAGDSAGVVTAFFAAINARDYRRAWDLGGKNLGSSYDTFANGFADTAHVDFTLGRPAGQTVSAQLHATNTDGSTQNFNGSYTVINGVITQGSQVAAP